MLNGQLVSKRRCLIATPSWRKARPAAVVAAVRANRAALVLACCAALAGVGGFVFWAVASRRAGAGNVGLAASWLALLPLLGTASTAGQAENVMRHLHHVQTRSLLARAYTTIAGGCLAVAAAAVLVPLIAGRSLALWGGYLPAFALTFVALLATSSSSLAAAIALARAKPQLLLYDAVPAALVKLAVLALIARHGAAAVAIAAIAGSVAGSVAITLSLRTLDALPARPKAATGATYSLGNLAAALVSALPAALTPALVAARAGNSAAAMTAIPLLMLPGLTMIPGAMARSFMAEGSARPERAGRLVAVRLVQALIPTVAVAAAVTVAAAPILALVGPQYGGAIWALRLCALAAVLATPGYLLETLLSIQKRVRIYTVTSLATTAISLAGSFAFASRGPTYVFAVWAGAALVGSVTAAVATWPTVRT